MLDLALYNPRLHPMISAKHWVQRTCLSIILCLSLCITGCDSNDLLSSTDAQLERIEHVQNGVVSREEWYYYDAQNRLVGIEESLEEGYRQVVEYEDDRVFQILRYQKPANNLTQKDSLVYNADGQIVSQYVIHFPHTEEQPVSRKRIDFEYGPRGLLERQISRSGGSRDRVTTLEYSRGSRSSDVARVGYIVDGQLRFEFFYLFDDKINYRRGDPRFLTDPVSGGDHNVIRSGSKDYTGALDVACNPCEFNYTYNRMGLPVRLGHNDSVYETRYIYREVESDSR